MYCSAISIMDTFEDENVTCTEDAKGRDDWLYLVVRATKVIDAGSLSRDWLKSDP